MKRDTNRLVEENVVTAAGTWREGPNEANEIWGSARAGAPAGQAGSPSHFDWRPLAAGAGSGRGRGGFWTGWLGLVWLLVLLAGCKPKATSEPLAPEATTPPPESSAGRNAAGAKDYFKTPFQTESQYIIEAIVSDLAEQLYYATHHQLPEDRYFSVTASEKPNSPQDTPVYELKIRLDGTSNPFANQLDLDLNVNGPIWSPELYEGVGTALARAVGLTPSTSASTEDTKRLARLLDSTPETIVKEDETLSAALAGDFTNAELHEQAALLLGAFAFRDHSGYFFDLRQPLCRLTAHLAMAHVLRGGGAYGINGRSRKLICMTGLAKVGPMTRNLRAGPKKERRRWMKAFTLVPAAGLWLALASQAVSVAAATDAAHWMGAVSGKKRVSELSIPGTHDSGALHEPFPGTTQCQTLGIAQQLAIGVRFLDIRCRSVRNAFAIYHGPVDQQLTFDSVLADCLGFLKDHGTETIIMSVKKEGEAEHSTKSFEELFDAYAAQAPEKWWLNGTIPLLEAARGRIILLQRFQAAKLPKGIAAAPEDWKDNQGFHIHGAAEIQVQDNYKLEDQQDKWPEVLAMLQAAAAGKPDTLYLNFTSGYRPGPILGIPDIRAISNVVNPAVSRYFDQTGPGRYGIIIMDFADASRCAKIIATNK